MTPDEMIEVIQAYKDGKKIQYKAKGLTSDWQDCTDPSGPAWHFLASDYRVKPEPKKPREWVLRGNCSDYSIKAVHGPCMALGEVVRVREVLE